MNGFGFPPPSNGLPSTEEDAFRAKLTPEVLQRFMELGVLDEESADLDAQMEQALALQQGSGQQHTTPGGAVMGGLADMLNGLRGSSDLKAAREAKAGIRDKKVKGRKSVWDLINGTGAAPAPDPYWGGQAFGDPNAKPPEALAASSPFGYGGGSPYGWK